LQALRILESIFTSVYVADQKLKKAYKVYKAGKRLLYVKRNKEISLGKDNIYETNKEKTLVSATPLLTAFFSNSIIQDFQDSPDDEEDTRSSQEYMNDHEEEFQERDFLAKFERFFKGSNSSSDKNKGLIAKTYERDKEKVSSDDNEGIKVKALMTFASEERIFVGKESASNEPSLAPAKDNRMVTSASKTYLAPAGKLKNVKIEDDPPLATVMKELNELKLQLSKNKLSYSINHQSQQVMFCKKCKIIDHITCDHAEFMSSIKTTQHLTGQGKSSSRSRPSRPAIPFLLAYIVGTMIINLMIVYTILYVSYVEVMIMILIVITNHNDIEWFRRRKALLAKKSRANKTVSSNV
nr:retrovirus-related Pol polyprotein from transposon TNT 1-94 [Tanacetum cinerariifolium]